MTSANAPWARTPGIIPPGPAEPGATKGRAASRACGVFGDCKSWKSSILLMDTPPDQGPEMAFLCLPRLQEGRSRCHASAQRVSSSTGASLGEGRAAALEKKGLVEARGYRFLLSMSSFRRRGGRDRGNKHFQMFCLPGRAAVGAPNCCCWSDGSFCGFQSGSLCGVLSQIPAQSR